MGLMFTSISATVLQVSWDSPEVSNGVIQLYSVVVEAHTGPVFQESVPGEQRTLLVTTLGMIDHRFLDYIQSALILYFRQVHSLQRVNQSQHYSWIWPSHQQHYFH
jgi:hypothetical protein